MNLSKYRYMIRGAILSLSLVVATSLLVTIPQHTKADDWPNRPITIVVPAGSGGNNDRAARLIAPFLSEELGVPVTVVNRPGGGNMLGHVYMLQQPADGYTLVRTTASPYIYINHLLQRAAFKPQDFAPINLPTAGFTFVGTALNSPYKTIQDFIKALKDKPGRISVGVQPTSTDMVNLQHFLKKFNLSAKDIRLVTFDGGRSLLTGIIGGQFDIGLLGSQGRHTMRKQWRTLMLFAEEPVAHWKDVPLVGEVMAKYGVKDYSPIYGGSVQGYLIHAKLRKEHPKRWERLVQAFRNISNNPKAQQAHLKAGLDLDWIGPEKSERFFLQQFDLINNPEVLKVLRPG
ncbi:MAG: tripartite tricarboxylate transporter substrate binding protein [Alphaproteobacteria bacterium]